MELDKMKLCGSCKRPIANMKGVAKFKCPKCLKYIIVRCPSCRSLAAKYYCPECEFEGPY